MFGSFDSRSDFLWVSPYDPMPDVCCSCGLFTDNRVKVKHKAIVEKPSGDDDGCGAVLLLLLVNVALGPLGWLISAYMSEDKSADGNKLVKQKLKVKMAQCLLCHGTEPLEPVDVDQSRSCLMFLVHPKFKSRFEEVKKSVNPT